MKLWSKLGCDILGAAAEPLEGSSTIQATGWEWLSSPEPSEHEEIILLCSAGLHPVPVHGGQSLCTLDVLSCQPRVQDMGVCPRLGQSEGAQKHTVKHSSKHNKNALRMLKLLMLRGHRIWVLLLLGT